MQTLKCDVCKMTLGFILSSEIVNERLLCKDCLEMSFNEILKIMENDIKKEK